MNPLSPRKTTMTLCLIVQNGNVLLGMKKRGFGAGWWNGFGGKVHEGEDLENAVQRELHEEAGIRAVSPKKQAILTFEFKNSPQFFEGHVFFADAFTGEPRETEEMKPQWFSITTMPYGIMWPGDRYWMPSFFAGRRFRAYLLFDGNKHLLSHELNEVPQHEVL